MTKARIYQPDKNAMQSGTANSKQWRLQYTPEKPFFINALTGWTGMSDMRQELELRLSFETMEEAVSYARAQHLPYEVVLPNKRHQVPKAYADNFKSGKING